MDPGSWWRPTQPDRQPRGWAAGRGHACWCAGGHPLAAGHRPGSRRAPAGPAIAAVETRIKMAVAQANTSLVELFGVGPVLAATCLGDVGEIGRFPSQTKLGRLSLLSEIVYPHPLSTEGCAFNATVIEPQRPWAPRVEAAACRCPSVLVMELMEMVDTPGLQHERRPCERATAGQDGQATPGDPAPR
jgi:hypothetical protein